MKARDEGLAPITERYALILNIPCYIDAQGRRWTNALWYKDILEHVKYIENLVLVSPFIKGSPPHDCACLSDNPALDKVRYEDLPYHRSFLSSLLHLPFTLLRLRELISQAEIIHTGVAGWPFPYGWLAIPIARIKHKFIIIVIESAFWRLSDVKGHSIRKRFRAWISETINKWCVNNTDLPIFTQGEYRQQLLTRNPEKGHVINASWIDREIIIDAHTAKHAWERKQTVLPGKIRLLYAGRLIPDKGVQVMIQAASLLNEQNIPLALDIIGSGELASLCQAASSDINGSVTLRVLEPIPYDRAFFEFIRQYDAILIPSISDEQPRIVYDAYSQAVPVIASDTPGLRVCIKDGETGKLVAPRDHKALAEVLRWASNNRKDLQQLGLRCIQRALEMTHEEMHKKRWRLILQAWNQPVS